jgi:hypothetical protein
VSGLAHIQLCASCDNLDLAVYPGLDMEVLHWRDHAWD